MSTNSEYTISYHMAMALLHHHLLLLLPLLLFFLPFALSDDPIGTYCSKTFNSKKTQANINSVLSDIVAKASVGGFATGASSGNANSGIIYGLAQCRADISSHDCSTCLADAAKALPAACPGQADARIWYDYCFVRYDDEDFVGKSDTGYAILLYNVENVTGDGDAFDKAVGEVMRTAQQRAVEPGSVGLGRAKAAFSPYVTLYGLAQCTRDIEQLACAQCLSQGVETFANFCMHRKGCRVLYSSCMVRYEIYPFFFPLDQSSSGTKSEAKSYLKLILSP